SSYPPPAHSFPVEFFFVVILTLLNLICHLGGFFNAGGKILPKKKPPQKTTSITNHTINAQEKNNMAYRLLSAKDHKIKELKNEAAVLQNKLKTFTTENKILKRLQSRHLKAISKYENAEINLPDLLATRSSEVQTLKAHLRTSQKEERRASKKLRDVQAQLLKTTDSLRALQKLSGDKKLEEREQLQCKLTSLTQKLEACDKKTQDMEKQLSSNTISFRHQLSVEKKKIIEAQSIRANLQVEIKSLKLKLQVFRNLNYIFLTTEDIQDTCPRVEKNIHPENTERQKNRRERQGLDLLKQEFEKLQTEPSFLLTPCVQPKENNLEDVTVEKQENKDEAKEAVCHKLTRHRTTSTFKKQYVFSEAIQNLHQGYPSTGPLVNPKIPSSRRSRNWQQGETGDFVEDSVSSYEPSFAKFPKERQKDNPSTLKKKRLLLEKLFGPNRCHPSKVGKMKTQNVGANKIKIVSNCVPL
uniref:Lebercilin-like protein n=1 Tax=Pseudonaja textilis TaxID=8673 RepID=A0A670YF69_PSETE